MVRVGAGRSPVPEDSDPRPAGQARSDVHVPSLVESPARPMEGLIEDEGGRNGAAEVESGRDELLVLHRAGTRSGAVDDRDWADEGRWERPRARRVSALAGAVAPATPWLPGLGVTSYVGSNGAPFPLLDDAGVLLGFCLPTGTDQCFSLSGVVTPAPP